MFLIILGPFGPLLTFPEKIYFCLENTKFFLATVLCSKKSSFMGNEVAVGPVLIPRMVTSHGSFLQFYGVCERSQPLTRSTLTSAVFSSIDLKAKYKLQYIYCSWLALIFSTATVKYVWKSIRRKSFSQTYSIFYCCNIKMFVQKIN